MFDPTLIQPWTAAQAQAVTEEWTRCVRPDAPMYFVLDDDPTGGQTVHDVPVFTAWDEATLREAFLTGSRLVYLMTNSRSLSAQQTTALYEQLLTNLKTVSKELERPCRIISRGDSTLRGHYPLESNLIRRSMNEPVKELLIPAFPEGNRVTYHAVQYLLDEGKWIPCAQSDYAADKTFGYHSSDLRLWVEEKTAGACRAKEVCSIPLELIRECAYDAIEQLLTDGRYACYAVDALCYTDLKAFYVACARAEKKGVRFLARTASAWPRVAGVIDAAPLLEPGKILDKTVRAGGLIIVGSHVNRTTRQLEALIRGGKTEHVVFDQHRVLHEEELEQEILRASQCVSDALKQGKNVVLATRRERLDLPDASAEQQLEITGRISRAFTDCVRRITVRPSFVITKGGITSSDIVTKALNTRRAMILGQIYPGVPVWRLGAESRYPGMPVVIFPGNVGEDDALCQVSGQLCAAERSKTQEEA